MLDCDVTSADLVSVRAFLLEQLVRLAYKEGDFLLSSGQKSSYYINGKQVTLTATGAVAIARLILPLLPADTQAVAGLTLGADPLVSAVSVVSLYAKQPVAAIIVRKEAKGHGTKAYLEGPTLPAQAQVVVLEDVVTTGKSALDAVTRLTAAGYQVTQIIAVVDRLQGARELYQAHNLNFQALFSLDELQSQYALDLNN